MNFKSVSFIICEVKYHRRGCVGEKENEFSFFSHAKCTAEFAKNNSVSHSREYMATCKRFDVLAEVKMSMLVFWVVLSISFSCTVKLCYNECRWTDYFCCYNRY
jgi:hypothetical protein